MMEIIKRNLKVTIKYLFLKRISKCYFKIKTNNSKLNKILDKEKNCYIINKDGNQPLLFIHSGKYFKNPLNYQIRFLKKIANLTNHKIYIPFYYSPNLKNIFNFINSFSSPSILCQGLGGGITISLYNKLKKIKKIICISPCMQFDNYFLDSKVRKDFIGISNPYLTEIDDDVESLIISSGKLDLQSSLKLFCKNNISKNIKWLNYENMSDDFIFYPSRESLEPTYVISDFLQN